MMDTHTDRLSVIVAADADLSIFNGYTCRIMAFASELKKNGIDVTLVVPKPSKNRSMIDPYGVNLVYIPIKQKGGSITNTLQRRRLLIKKVKELQKNSSITLIESSTVGGYFAMTGFSGYVLDIHGVAFDEINYAILPWYVPKSLYQRYTYFLERIAVKRAIKVVTVSDTMAKFIINEWNAPKHKISIVSNGYFASQVANITEKRVEERKGLVTFVGALAKWASVDKIIRVANIFKNEGATFYIIGGGTSEYRQELEELARSYGLTNVVFTGSVPLNGAYELIARSEVLLLPFPKTLCTDVACPIKVLEYMAFGKAMVIDEVSDLSRFLKENDAAFVCDPDDEEAFAEGIRILLKDAGMRKRIGMNAKRLVEEFSWEKQGQNLAKVVDEVGNLEEMKKVEV
ncbi:MAG: hypothetical protein C4B59_04800 [Candidatus Methanogaster sp.]|uniref:Uncharacterized protein n=1 Tax=Candidatus Methanogaster sp. TaxID=3386292 RepID=A0AC61L4D5_9EURY|nr:MAG: hypothetical protein C4B59_04800 [ANME-2 cluster archaeon]